MDNPVDNTENNRNQYLPGGQLPSQPQGQEQGQNQTPPQAQNNDTPEQTSNRWECQPLTSRRNRNGKRNGGGNGCSFGKVLLYVILSLAAITIFYGIVFNLFIGGLNSLDSLSTPGHSGVTRPSIGVVEILGNIEDSKPVSEVIRTYENDPLIEAVLVRIDSPGGGVAPSQEIFQDILRLRKTKKVVVSMGSTAASGGYYIACAADRIVASPGTLTGSIGVISQTAQVNTLMSNLGIETATFKSGKLKDTGSPLRPIEQGDQELMKSLVDNLFQQFVDDVRTQRGLDDKTVEQISDGRVLSGKQAHELGLVDDLGNLHTAREKLVEIAGIDKDLPLAYPPDKTIPLLLRLILREGASAALNAVFEQKPGMKIQYSLPGHELGLGD